MIKAPLIGVDISHHNHPFNSTFGDFQIHKATEGRTFTDPKFLEWANRRVGDEYLNGVYHFFSSSSSAEDQVDHFLEVVRQSNLTRTLIILDLEEDELVDAISGDKEALKWLKIVQRVTATRPILYTNTYGSTKLPKEFGEYPLWIASYDKKAPKIGSLWKNNEWKLWQFATKPFDVDLFNGLEQDWRNMEYVL